MISLGQTLTLMLKQRSFPRKIIGQWWAFLYGIRFLNWGDQTFPGAERLTDDSDSNQGPPIGTDGGFHSGLFSPHTCHKKVHGNIWNSCKCCKNPLSQDSHVRIQWNSHRKKVHVSCNMVLQSALQIRNVRCIEKKHQLTYQDISSLGTKKNSLTPTICWSSYVFRMTNSHKNNRHLQLLSHLDPWSRCFAEGARRDGTPWEATCWSWFPIPSLWKLQLSHWQIEKLGDFWIKKNWKRLVKKIDQ